jgi:hypothetical protein
MYDNTRLAEAIKAFGEERLEEYKKVHLEARLAYYHEYRTMISVCVVGVNDEGTLIAIDKYNSWRDIDKSELTYLEPPRPLRNGHTKEEILTAYLDGDADRVHKDSRTANEYYDATFPTATAPTEEIKEEPQLTPSDPVKPSATSPQPQPSFTREEMLTEGERAYIQSALQDRFNSQHESYAYLSTICDKLDKFIFQPLPTRLDLLIKFHGEQDRPSELEFVIIKGGMVGSIWKAPSEYSTHYRRGTSEWISLEGVV